MSNSGLSKSRGVIPSPAAHDSAFETLSRYDKLGLRERTLFHADKVRVGTRDCSARSRIVHGIKSRHIRVFRPSTVRGSSKFLRRGRFVTITPRYTLQRRGRTKDHACKSNCFKPSIWSLLPGHLHRSLPLRDRNREWPTVSQRLPA
jgi:hypothetical protein